MNVQPEHTPLVSIIIPVKNGAATLDACLRSIKRSYYKNYEVLVVDDHSTDDTVSIAQRFQYSVLQVTEGKGANNARNVGASKAHGDIFIFIDSDIVIERETILGIVETLEEDHLDAVVGIYTARHRHESFVSQYKNLWVRYSYMKSSPEIDWLFGAISGIRRKAFEQLGGFNTALLARHGHDDIELGKRAAQAKLNIMLDMDIEVEHLKQYTLGSFILNEYHRSVGFAELATQFGETAKSVKHGFVNVYPTFVLSTMFSLMVVATIIASAGGWVSDWWAITALGVYLLLNIRFLNYLEQVRGLFAMFVMVPFLFIDHIVCLVGSVVGVLRGLRKKTSTINGKS
ncbi:MAG: glycosyltransferase [Ignavibacteriae bacterium]|nr:glycosyltransferase [Ignavibacteria bacterium]MBI3364601.1 glycosyltransferase [Ignavibacteriota bacterium]